MGLLKKSFKMNKKLFSFKRCPYAIRTRMVLKLCKINYELIEVDLKNKPEELIKISPKATVPVFILENGVVIDESIKIIQYALGHKPESLLNIAFNTNKDRNKIVESEDLIFENDVYFKHYLDRYKYHVRFPENNQLFYRQKAELFLEKLEKMLKMSLKEKDNLELNHKEHQFLLGKELKYIDIAIFPFVRQFCYVDDKWFKKEDKYKNLVKWLGVLENLRNYLDKI